MNQGELAVLDDGTEVQAKGGKGQENRFLLVSGTPFREPVARYGRFVMNTKAEIHQAIEDYKAGKLQSSAYLTI